MSTTVDVLARSLGDLTVLDWEPFDVPGGSEPVAVSRLHAEPESRAVTLVVRFPAGWRRPEAGSYAAAEEVYLIDGALEMNGTRYEAGTWFRVPAGAVRRQTATPQGAIALARFDGPARWTPERSAP